MSGERFEPRSHFISRWIMIVRVSVALNRAVVENDVIGRECFWLKSRLNWQTRSITIV